MEVRPGNNTVKNEIQAIMKLWEIGSVNMKSLKTCPKCGSELIVEHERVQVCTVCKYWTTKGTARLNNVMIFA